MSRTLFIYSSWPQVASLCLCQTIFSVVLFAFVFSVEKQTPQAPLMHCHLCIPHLCFFWFLIAQFPVWGHSLCTCKMQISLAEQISHAFCIDRNFITEVVSTRVNRRFSSVFCLGNKFRPASNVSRADCTTGQKGWFVYICLDINVIHADLQLYRKVDSSTGV